MGFFRGVEPARGQQFGVLVDRPLELLEHIRLRAFQVLDAPVDVLKLARQCLQSLLPLALSFQRFQFVLKELRLDQCLVPVPDCFGLLEILNEVSVSVFVGKPSQLAALEQVMLPDLLLPSEVRVALLDALRFALLLLEAHLQHPLLQRTLPLLFEFVHDLLHLLLGAPDALQLALPFLCEVYLMYQLALFALQVHDPRDYLVLVLLSLLDRFLCAALRARGEVLAYDRIRPLVAQ